MSSSNHIHSIYKKKGLVQPYPHMVRTVLGSGIVSLIFSIILIIGYISYQAAVISMDFIQQKIHTLPWNKNPCIRLPKPNVLVGQSHRELLLHTTIPYIEKITLPLTDSARQADFALIQTLTRLNIDKDHLFLVVKEYKQNNNETYLFQKIRLFLSEDANVFINMLQEHLDVWAENVKLTAYSEHIYKLTINEIPTHELILTPVSNHFISSPIDEKPRITIVIDDLGENIHAANTLISFEIPITLSILPQSRYATDIALAAHEAGREVLIHQPMQSIQSPYVSAGPKELTMTMSPKKIEEIVHANIKKIPFASGMNNHMGSAFTCNEKKNALVCKILAKEGLFVLDSVTHSKSSFCATAQKQGLTAFRRTIFLDHGIHSEATVLQQLKYAEKLAYTTGKAILIGHPYPETIAAIKKWINTRDTSIHIVPLRYQEIAIDPLESKSL